MHRALADPSADGRPTVTRLHDLLAAALPLATLERVLDAGCGMGGTMLDLAARSAATFTGLTLSAQQADVGRRAIARAGLSQRVEILVRNYDRPPEQTFDAAIAVESLAHSPQPAASLRAIAARLAHGAWVAIVDDMPEPAARGSHDLAALQRGWRLPVLASAMELGEAFARCGLSLAADHDLTSDVRPRTLRRIATLERVNRLLRRLAPGSARHLLDSYHGGLALERLYRHGRMRYRLLVARKTTVA